MNFNGIILRLSSAGVLITSDISFGVSDDDGIYSISQSANGDLAKVGYTFSFGAGVGTSDFLLHIFNAANTFLVGPTYGGTKMEKAYCINNTTDGGYIICGYSSSYTNLDHIYLVKTDSNGISAGNVNVVVTGIAENTKSSENFRIFPNPANDKVYLNINSKSILTNSSFTIGISDVLGREYSQKVITNYQSNEPIELNTETLNKGVYIIIIKGSVFSENIKLIVQH